MHDSTTRTVRPALLPAHTPLPSYYGESTQRAEYVRSLFDQTASDYDRIEAVLALGSGPWYRRQALRRAGLKAGDHVLDVGVGTGLLAREAAVLLGTGGGGIVGIDPSPGMMSQVNVPGIELIQGTAEVLPRPDGSSSFVTMGYALRHIGDVNAAFAEFHRVLEPGGRLCILEITRPTTRWARALLRTYMRGAVPLIARCVGSRDQTSELWRYYWDTIEACISPSQVLQALHEAGFEQVHQHVELGIFSEFTARRLA